jgi:hypothetical protein
MDADAPFLRRPFLALEHARAAVMQLPTDPDALSVLVRAEAECLRFPQAQDLAETMVDDAGRLTPTGRVLIDWVRDTARHARLEGLR